MGDEDRIADELTETRNDLLDTRSWCKHRICQSGDDRNLRRKSHPGVHKGVKGANCFAPCDLYCTNFADEVLTGVGSGGFYVEHTKSRIDERLAKVVEAELESNFVRGVRVTFHRYLEVPQTCRTRWDV